MSALPKSAPVKHPVKRPVRRPRIGLMGGSFNPAHAGHRDMSIYALKRLQLDAVWWLVSPQNPLKATKGMASLPERVSRAEKIARHPRIVVTDIERTLHTRYTVDTLRALKRRYPHVQFVWLMGADNMMQLPRWKQWQAIFKLVPVAVFRRPSYAAGRSKGKVAARFDNAFRRANCARILAAQTPPAWLVLDNQLNRLSATQLREEKTRGKS